MRRLAILSLATLCVGCFHERAAFTGAPTPVADRFRASIGKGFEQSAVESPNPSFTVTRVTFPSRRPDRPENARMGMTLRRPIGMPRGLIVVLPILGGDYGPSEGFAEAITEAGFTTLRFDRKAEIFDPKKDFRHVASMMVEGVVDVRRGLAWALEQRLAGRGRVGLLGISMGSFVGTLVAATDPNVDAAILALGGGNLPDILHTARGEQEIDALFDALEARGWSPERIRDEAVRDLAAVEPLDFAPAIPPDTTMLIQARFDGVVPFANGQLIYDAMHRPERLVLLTGHYTAAFLWPYLVRAMTDHFTKHLDPDVTARPPLMP